MTRRRRLLVAGLLAVTPIAAAAAWIAWPLPDGLGDPVDLPSVTLTDRHGTVLRSTRGLDGALVRWQPIEAIDPDILMAFVVLEDHRFFDHGGVDLRSVLRAARDNLRTGRIVSGASTISMQVARLLHPTPRTWWGKARQAMWALRIDLHMTKQQILEQYVNRIPLGQGAVGVEAAAQLYFDRSARDVTLAQAALLAGIARSPSAANPLVAPAVARERRGLVLARLLVHGYADSASVARAAREPLIERDRTPPFLAPHFTTRFLTRFDRQIREGRTVWRSTIHLRLQAALESEVRHAVRELEERGGRHAAAVVLHNPTGEILAWVGSPDFWADTAGQVDMVVSARQPGSALKPFLYGLAFDRGYTPATVLADVPVTFQTPTGPYEPRNYDRIFHGPVRAREALASSFNVPAVALTAEVGPAGFLNTLHRAGFASLDRPAVHYGVGLALGNGDVTLLELANAYRTLARLGRWDPVRWTDGASPTMPLPSEASGEVMSPRAAALVLDILGDADARIAGFGPQTPFDFPFPAAVKTGTSRRFTDNWAVATTGGFTVAVWVGNFSGRPMQGVSGVSGAGPLLRRAVLQTARWYDAGTLPLPSEVGAVPRRVCALSGELPGRYCPTVDEWFVPGTEPHETCGWHRDGRVVLPAAYTAWADRYATDPVWDGLRLTEIRAGLTAERGFHIVEPMDGDVYEVPPGVASRFATLALRAAGAEHTQVRWFVDGTELAGPKWQIRPGPHTLRAVSPDGAVDEVRIEVR